MKFGTFWDLQHNPLLNKEQLLMDVGDDGGTRPIGKEMAFVDSQVNRVTFKGESIASMKLWKTGLPKWSFNRGILLEEVAIMLPSWSLKATATTTNWGRISTSKLAW
jgi:hypothetical protein